MRFTLASTLALAAVLVAAGSGRAQLFGGGDVAAKVNGETISLTDVKSVLEQRPSPVPLAKEQERAVRKAALDMLVDDTLMRQYLRRVVPMPNPVDVDKVLEDLKSALRKQNKTLDQFLREEKQSEQQLRGDIITDLQWKTLLANRFSETEAKAYFEANRPFFEKVQVKASHILIKVAPTAPSAEREDYKARLENLRSMILNGKLTFEEAAKKYSECPSKKDGGDLGYFTYKFMVVEPFARTAFATPPHEISQVVTTELGLHLIKVTDRTAPDPTPFDALKDIVRKTMAQEQNLFRTILEEQRRSSKIELVMQ